MTRPRGKAPIHPVVALLVIVAAASGCGKADVAIVKQPVIPIYECWRTWNLTHNQPCLHRFNAGRLIALRLDAAERLAEQHGYSVRVLAPPRGREETADLELNRIDVECAEIAANCVVARIVERG